jgi:hypothetical protein
MYAGTCPQSRDILVGHRLGLTDGLVGRVEFSESLDML